MNISFYRIVIGLHVPVNYLMLTYSMLLGLFPARRYEIGLGRTEPNQYLVLIPTVSSLTAAADSSWGA